MDGVRAALHYTECSFYAKTFDLKASTFNHTEITFMTDRLDNDVAMNIERRRRRARERSAARIPRGDTKALSALKTSPSPTSRNRHLKGLSAPQSTSIGTLLAPQRSISDALKDSKRATDAVAEHTKRKNLETTVLSSHRIRNGDILALVSVKEPNQLALNNELPSIFVVRLRNLATPGIADSQVMGILNPRDLKTTSLHDLRWMADSSGTYLGLMHDGASQSVTVYKIQAGGDIVAVKTLAATQQSRALSEGELSLTVKPGSLGESVMVVRAVTSLGRVPNFLLAAKLPAHSQN